MLFRATQQCVGCGVGVFGGIRREAIRQHREGSASESAEAVVREAWKCFGCFSKPGQKVQSVQLSRA